MGDTATFDALVSGLGTTQKARRPLHKNPEFIFYPRFLLALFARTAPPPPLPPPSPLIPTLLDPPSLTDNRVHLPRFPGMLDPRGVHRTRGDVQGESSLKNARCRVLPGILPVPTLTQNVASLSIELGTAWSGAYERVFGRSSIRQPRRLSLPNVENSLQGVGVSSCGLKSRDAVNVAVLYPLPALTGPLLLALASTFTQRIGFEASGKTYINICASTQTCIETHGAARV